MEILSFAGLSDTLKSSLKNLRTNYDASSQSWNTCIPSKIINEFPVNRPHLIAFKISFSADSFMHVAYRVAIEDEIVPAFEASETEIDLGSTKNLFISADGSSFKSDNVNGLLSYEWICQGAL